MSRACREIAMTTAHLLPIHNERRFVRPPPTARPFVSIVIPHYNDLRGLAACIAGLKRQTWPLARMEIIVADNNSVCGLDAVICAASGCRVISVAEQGAGPARNAGAAVARGEILGFIDSDCDPRTDWVEHGVRELTAYDFVGGEVEIVPRDPARPTPVEAWEMVFGFNFEHYILVQGYTGSGNMWVWRSVFEAVGGFRNGVAEDMEWSFRARSAGFRLGYARDAVVGHPARAAWSELVARWRRVLREHFALACQGRFGRLRWTAKTAAMPISIGPHLLKVLRSRRLRSTRSKLAAGIVLIAHRLWRTVYMAQLLVISLKDGRW